MSTNLPDQATDMPGEPYTPVIPQDRIYQRRDCFDRGLNARVLSPKDEARFLRSCLVFPDTGCWMWIGNFHAMGHARFRAHNRDWVAHQLSFRHFVGSLLRNQRAHRMCGGFLCVNPYHLKKSMWRRFSMRHLDPHPKKHNRPAWEREEQVWQQGG